MLKKRDWIIIGAVLLLALAFFVIRAYSIKVPSGQVRISVNGVEYGVYDLTKPREIVVGARGNRNVIRIDEQGGVDMVEASCGDQICVHQGIITPDNMNTRALMNTFICLPNQVYVEVILEENT